MKKNKSNGFEQFEKAMLDGKPFAFIVQDENGMVHVSGTCDKAWLAKAIDAIRMTLPGVKDVPETQCKVVEVN